MERRREGLGFSAAKPWSEGAGGARQGRAMLAVQCCIPLRGCGLAHNSWQQAAQGKACSAWLGVMHCSCCGDFGSCLADTEEDKSTEI